jgi:hypothetical protein
LYYIDEDGEPDLVVELHAQNGDLVDETWTDDAGYYRFDNVPPGQYYVQFQPPAGLAFTIQHAGWDPEADSDPDPATGRTPTFSLSIGQLRTDQDAGIISGIIAGYTWYDQNGDGIKENPLILITPIHVTLYDANDNVVAETDSNGTYGFGDLQAGTYRVHFALPTGYAFTIQDAGTNDTLDSDVNSTGWTVQFTLLAGEYLNYMDAGYVMTGGGGGGGGLGGP